VLTYAARSHGGVEAVAVKLLLLSCFVLLMHSQRDSGLLCAWALCTPHKCIVVLLHDESACRICWLYCIEFVGYVTHAVQ
jgi:hypothetical protein